MQLKPISQQVVAIAGASSGIGRQTALQFAQQGAKVVVAARNEVGLKSLVDEIRQQGGEATHVIADVADFEQVKAIADTTVGQYGRMDTWVHVAAIGVFGLFEEITPEEFQRVVDVTLMGQVYGAMAALPHLKREGRGALIHISSMEGRRSLPLQSPYSASKHGVEGFLESLRVELQHEGIPISVTSILPAVINTPYYNHARTKLGVKPMAMPPFYSPKVVADAVLYVAEHPIRDYIVGDAGRALDLLQRLSPELVDLILTAIAFPLQRTNQPKAEYDANNLYEPMPGFNRVEGDFGHLTIPSVSDWIAMSPVATAIADATAGLTSALTSTFKDGKNNGKHT